MMRILATLLRPDAGTVTVAGFDVISEVHLVRRAISLTGSHGLAPTTAGNHIG